MPDPRYKQETVQVRGSYKPGDHNYSAAVPIYQTAAFALGNTDRALRLSNLQEKGFFYTRGGNPTTDILEKRIAELEGGTGALAVGSGMAAVAFSIFNVAEGGGEIAAVRTLYSGSFNLFYHILPRFGIKINWIEDPHRLEDYRKAITPETRAVFIEVIGNPSMDVPDIEEISKIAHENGIPLIADNTFCTPHLLRPIDYGADIVVHSGTKALGGHGSSIAGLIVESGRFNWANGKFPHFTEPDYNLQNRSMTEVVPNLIFTTRIRMHFLNDFGAALSPFNSYLILQGIETLSVRVDRQVENTGKIIRYLLKHPMVSWVDYPLLEGNKNYNNAKKYFKKGAGSIFTFGFKGNDKTINKFIDSLKLFIFMVNLGDAKSMVIRPYEGTHKSLSPENRLKAGVKPEAIRLSIGLENADDLIEDLEQAFACSIK
ncbi:MAG: O-acetylhomoserine aminocarboxypropyltransferase/cysteine synthase family protein [Brevinematales bacterium]|jgi:O-acetylhomoserine (thiol)-lyase